MIDCHFMVHFFFMKCECVMSGHCVQIELSLWSIGSMMMVVEVATIKFQAIMKVVQVVILVADGSFIPVV